MNDTEKLTRAVRAFHEAAIDFVLIGGLAMIAHGANNLTRDVDFADAAQSEKLERLAASLRRFTHVFWGDQPVMDL